MANGFPCPNPTCTHVFPPASVTGAMALTCPRCGTVFQFRSGPPAPPVQPAGATPPRAPLPPAPARPASPAWAPPAAPALPPAWAPPVPPATSGPLPDWVKSALPPPAAPMAVTPTDVLSPELPAPMSAPAEPAAHADVFAPPSELVFIPSRRHKGSWLGPFLFFIGFTVVLGGGAVAALFYTGILVVGADGVRIVPKWSQVEEAAEAGKAAGTMHHFEQFNFRLQAPPAPWKRDDANKPAGKLNLLTLQRTRPRAWMAVAAQDHSKGRPPRDAELVDEAVRRLRTYFKDSLEYDLQPDAELAGERAVRLSFRGVDGTNQVLNGDAYLMAFKGIAYWFLTWAPDTDAEQAQKEYGDLRQRFSLLDRRDDWPDKRPRPVTLSGTKSAYTLEDLDDIWKSQPDPAEDDPAADLDLRANDPVAARDEVLFARVLVLVLRPDAERKPEAVARDHYEARHKKEKIRIAVVSDRAGQVGDASGHITKLHVRKGQDRERLLVLAVVADGKDLIVVQCECDWKRRSLWERDFDQLIGTFRKKK